MAVTIKNTNDSIQYTFPPKPGVYGGFALTEETVNQRNGVAQRIYAHGAVISGDGKFGSRVIELHGIMQCLTATELDTELDSLKYHLGKINLFENHPGSERRLYVPQNNSRRYYKIGGLLGMEVERASSVDAKISLTFQITDPFMYARNADRRTEARTITVPSGSSSATKILAAPPESLNYGYPAVPYEITVECTAGPITRFHIRNRSDAWRMIKFEGPLRSTSNNKVVFNVEEGTATGYGGIWGTKGTDVMSGLTYVKWFSMRPEGNSIEYGITGTAGRRATFTIKWRPRWL